MIQTFLDRVWTMLQEAGMEINFWAEEMYHAL